MSGAYKHLVWVFNRRAGKDKTALYGTIECMQRRVGNYVHVFPTMAEGRQNLWENIDGSGFPVIDHFPQELVENKREDTMRIRLKNGSTWRVGGANKPDSFRGGNPVGIVWSEYALMKPSVRLVADPILRENGGWEVFVYTPKGANHGMELYEQNRDNPDWYVELLTNDDTHTYSEMEIEAMRKSGIPEEWIQQEIYCSFAAAMVGSYYGNLIESAEREGRVGRFPHDPSMPVETAWDLGIGADDATSIWFIQVLAGGFRAIDYYETNTEGLPEVCKMLQEKPYVYGKAYFPHDVKKRELSKAQGRGAGTRLDTILELMPMWKNERGRQGHRVIPAMNPIDRINATRLLIPRFEFDREGTKDGLDGLKSYQREEDEGKSKSVGMPFFKSHPLHNWASHPADAFGHFCVGTPQNATPKPTTDENQGEDYFTKLERRGAGRRGGWQG